MKTKKTDVVFQICQSMLAHSPERSYQRLNAAMGGTLTNCIMADLPFAPDTFRRIYDCLRGQWWFGDGAGSHVGEHFYSTACLVGHSSACQSFEAFAHRPAVLWENNKQSPERIHVGSELVWEGFRVAVTSLRPDRMVACSGTTPRRRFVIPYSDIVLFRQARAKRVSAIIKQIKASDGSEKSQNDLRALINSGKFLHWELARINTVFNAIAKEIL